MKVVAYNPFKPFAPSAFTSILDELAGRSISEFMGNNFVSGTPSVNIIEKEDSYDIEVAAPGLVKEDFSIELIKDQLIVSGTKESTTEDKVEGKYTRQEFNYKSFKRSFTISEDIDAERINASYADGILTINMGKKVEVQEPTKTIDIG